MNEQLRRTGRTTRLLEAAYHEAEKGNEVFVVTCSATQANRLIEQFIKTYGGKSDHPTPRVCLRDEDGKEIGSVIFQRPGGTFCWDQMGFFGADPDSPVFVDHYAIEKKYARILEELHRFDVTNEDKIPASVGEAHKPGKGERERMMARRKFMVQETD